LHVIASFEDPTTVFAAMRYLAGWGSPLPAHRLIPLLLQNDCPVRARAVAYLLRPSADMTMEALVRIGLLSDQVARLQSMRPRRRRGAASCVARFGPKQRRSWNSRVKGPGR
jgi:hypothetical protein